MYGHSQGTKSKEGFFEKLRNNHYIMILICIVPIIILLAGSYFFGWKNNSLLVPAFLAACMFGHMLMMKNHNH